MNEVVPTYRSFDVSGYLYKSKESRYEEIRVG